VNTGGVTAWRYRHVAPVRTLGWPHAPSFQTIIPDDELCATVIEAAHRFDDWLGRIGFSRAAR